MDNDNSHIVVSARFQGSLEQPLRRLFWIGVPFQYRDNLDIRYRTVESVGGKQKSVPGGNIQHKGLNLVQRLLGADGAGEHISQRMVLCRLRK